MIRLFQFIPTLLVTLVLASFGLAQGDLDVESKFIAMVKNSTLKGTWAPVQQNKLGAEKKDEGYRIVRAEKKDGDLCHRVPGKLILSPPLHGSRYE